MGILKAKVAGNWVPLEFSGGPNPQNALGIVAMGGTTNNIVTLAPAGVVLTTTITFTPLVGRRYVLKYQVRAIAATSLASGHVDLWIDGANVSFADSWFEAETSYAGRPFEWLIPSDGVQHTYQLRGVGPTSIQLHNQTTAGNVYFYIEDIGPSASPALPLPPTPQAWIPLPLQGSWRAELGEIQAPQYRKIGDVVTLRGTAELITATSPANSNLAVMPAGFRPPVMTRFSSGAHRSNVGGMTHVRMHLQPDGTFVVNELVPTMADPVVYLNDISYSVTP